MTYTQAPIENDVYKTLPAGVSTLFLKEERLCPKIIEEPLQLKYKPEGYETGF